MKSLLKSQWVFSPKLDKADSRITWNLKGPEVTKSILIKRKPAVLTPDNIKTYYKATEINTVCVVLA